MLSRATLADVELFHKQDVETKLAAFRVFLDFTEEHYGVHLANKPGFIQVDLVLNAGLMLDMGN